MADNILKALALILIGVVVILGLGVFFINNYPEIINSPSEKITGYAINNPDENVASSQENVECEKEKVPYEEEEEYIETVPYKDTVCEKEELPYSITNDRWDYSRCTDENTVCYEKEKNFWGNEECVDEETFCAEKQLSYSIDLKNLDQEKKGYFGVEIVFYKDGEEYDTVPVNKYLYPQTTETFTGRITVTGESPSGDANQRFSANYRVIDVPTKDICEEVTKYKDVKRTKTVTKYRTEEVCN